MRIISSAKPLCEKYRESNNLSPLPCWGNSDHQKTKSLVGLEIVSWSPTSYPQLVCCCCRDLSIPFCWGLTAVVPALLAWAGCITTCGALYMWWVHVQVIRVCSQAGSSQEEPISLWFARELSIATVSWDLQVLPFSFASECHHHGTLNGHPMPASSLRMTRWDKLPGRIQGPYCTPMLWERSRL